MSVYNEETGEIEQRTKLTDLIGQLIGEVKIEKRGNVHIYNQTGKCILMVSYDNLFDGDGNRFEGDI